MDRDEKGGDNGGRKKTWEARRQLAAINTHTHRYLAVFLLAK